MRHINFGATDIDLDNIKIIVKRYPYLNVTDVIRIAIREKVERIETDDPVAVEQARKQARKAGKK